MRSILKRLLRRPNTVVAYLSGPVPERLLVGEDRLRLGDLRPGRVKR